MIVTYKSITKIVFPVYILPSSNWQEQDGLVYLDNRLVDDRNMAGKTIGIRRMQTPMQNLMPIKGSLDSLVAILKQSHKTFIDTNGLPFIYEKTKSCPLRYYKIKRIERKETASVLWLKGISFPFKVPRPPTMDLQWAGLLHLGNRPWLLYEYSEEKLSDTRRKV